MSLTGFFTGLSLIVAIGAQNSYLLRIGLSKKNVGISVLICSLSDAILIFAGVAGMGAFVAHHKLALRIISGAGACYLLYYALKSLRRAFQKESLQPNTDFKNDRKKTILTLLGFTWLNPHVYLDTVLLVGSIGGHYGSQRWLFGIGAALASLCWFIALGYGAKLLAPLVSKPITWRVLDLIISAVMLVISINLFTYLFKK